MSCKELRALALMYGNAWAECPNPAGQLKRHLLIMNALTLRECITRER